ncbi:hypothetical protein HMPREF0083_01429 [Aneurinibacillus aneurinilyticus ATCC 12856]|uniref:Uncharacterized protein n=1 Tax=Aneurinibacillus aneurinilyticus ATCC 12856 TaxID=649747 RepID=U1X7J8_ANEAE|nr:hypothetical protein HMPREF0083_01429 [Aneurinibacillus aneurinilyticus ATCC 12856]
MEHSYFPACCGSTWFYHVHCSKRRSEKDALIPEASNLGRLLFCLCMKGFRQTRLAHGPPV